MVRKATQIFTCLGMLFLIPFVFAYATINYPDISILLENERELVFVYRPAEANWIASTSEPGSYSGLAIEHTSLTEIPGLPQLPVRSVYFALPPAADFEYQILDLQSAVKSPVRLPLYLSATSSDFPQQGPLPENVIRRLPVGEIRSQRIGGLAISPVTYYPGEERAEILASITIRVTFTGGDAASAGTVSEGGFDRVLGRLLLNTDTSPAMRRKAVRPQALARITEVIPFEAAHIWHKLRTGSDGVYRLTFQLADTLGLGPGSITDPRQIRIFAGSGALLPTPAEDTLPKLREIAIRTSGFEDGQWNVGDYLEFYGMDVHRWEVCPETNSFVNRRHAFEQYNVYWFTPAADLATPPLRMNERDGTPNHPEARQYFEVTAWVHSEENNVLRKRPDGYVGDYFHWYWQQAQLISISGFVAVDAVAGQPAAVHLRTYSPGNPVRLNVDGLPLEPAIQNQQGDSMVFALPSFTPGNQLQVSFAANSPGYMYLDSYDIAYQRELRLRSGRLKFAAPDTAGTGVFYVSNIAAAAPVILDITDQHAPQVITGAAMAGNVAAFQDVLSAGQRRLYWVCDQGEFNRPISAERRMPTSLFAADEQVDYLVLGPRQFVEAAEDYLIIQESRTGLRARIIDIADIYDNFSGGLLDPLAIQWFLKTAFENWPEPAPQYVLLLGDGHFDLADNLNTGAASYVPPYLAADEPMPADEGFVYFGSAKILHTGPPETDPYPDMIVGRWPVKNTAQVRTIAEKINRYSSSATFGAWRNRVALVADDEATGDCVYDPGNEVHTTSAEIISRSVIPEGIEQRKIYLMEYPFGSSCRSKPGAREAILDLINEGVALIDYIGHGNPDLWAHEHVLERANDVPKMQNKDRLTVVYTASCSNGFFDDPSTEGLAEEVLRWPEGGAVAAISATRLVFANANMALNTLVFELLYSGTVSSLGEALFLAKIKRQFDEDPSCPNPPCEQPNDRRFNLFGDPAMRFGAPEYRIVIDDVHPDTLPALGVVTVNGRITGDDGTTVNDFTGTADFLVSDALRERRYQVSEDIGVDYTLPGGTIFHGTIPVNAGEFSFGFIVPKDISYGDSTAGITGYAYTDDRDAGGGIGGLHLGGTAPGVIDTTGPTIEMRVGDQDFVSGMALAPESVVTLLIGDTSGVNLTGEPGHTITVTFDGDPAGAIDITQTFTYNPGDFRRGSASFAIPGDRPEGPITVTAKVWDNANNSAQLTVEAAIAEETEFRVLELLNYPNPFDRETVFYFRTNGVPNEAKIEIFTVGGKLIKSLHNAGDGRTVWDGTDDLGQRVANGVYLARLAVSGSTIEATASQADNTISEKIQKVVVWR
jgi:hypothetical protein